MLSLDLCLIQVLARYGTGSFGNAVLKRFLDTDIAEIRIFSRDEKKQDDMRRRYNNSKLKFYIGDVRDIRSVRQAMRDVDFVFHAAALKQVPSCEFHPMQAVQTNVIGAENVLEAAIDAGVKRVVCLSTDKAVYPINAMGISKAMMEKVMVAVSRNLDNANTVICGTVTETLWHRVDQLFPYLSSRCFRVVLSCNRSRMTRFVTC